MTPTLAAVAPPGDPSAARFVLVLVVGVLIGAGLMRALDRWDARAARPVCLNCCAAPVDEVGEYCTRCAPTRRASLPRRIPPRWSGPSPALHLPDPRRPRRRSSHGVVPPPDRRWRG